ncbi:hypothetical protein ACFWFX_16120 [Streptomyces roseolus]|uniref:hypothetical protein n=1 Tax=Streptomyces roseolus TaxID=67358 RepID=UPI00365D5E5F
MISLNLPKVPVPHQVAELMLATMPESVCEAAVEAESAVRELGRLRPLASDEDRADREDELGRLALANKTLAAYSPRFVIGPWERAA